MAITVWPPSPNASIPLNRGADVGFSSAIFSLTSTEMHVGWYDLGTVSKGVTDGIFYLMFEIDEPIGTVFNSIQLSLYVSLGPTGSPNNPFMMGLLAKDGTWNTQPESAPAGVGDYAVTPSFPQPTAVSDVLWASGAASISDIHNPSTFPAVGIPGRGTYGSVGTGSDFEDDQLLTDFNAAFIANESDRTVARGVPFMFFFRPTATGTDIFRFTSQNGAFTDRPSLTLDAALPVSDPIIYEVIAKASQINVPAKSAQASVAAKADQLDVTVKADQLDVTAKAGQLDVTAKPDMIEVSREE